MSRRRSSHESVAAVIDSLFNEVATASDRRRKLVSDSDSLFNEVATPSDRRRKHIRQSQAPPTAYLMKLLLLPTDVGSTSTPSDVVEFSVPGHPQRRLPRSRNLFVCT